MKKIFILLLLGTIAVTSLVAQGVQESSSQASGTKEKPLVVAMELAYPPFETKDQEGNPSGISVDFSKAFGQYINRDVKIENIAWDGLIPSLQTGKADMVISSMTITDQRKQVVDFSVPYANAQLAILANKNSGIKSIDDLNKKGKKIAVKNGSTGFLYAQNHLANAQLIVLADESACVTEVVQGKADGFLYDQLTIYRNWQNHLDTTSAVFIPFQDVEKWGVAVRKGNIALLDQLNAFIPKFTAEGGFDKLTQKYLSKEKADFDRLGFKWFFDLD
ncbi:MAG: transporter substrate-binding domain-containing protein [Spirochaetia bacterium]|jgi:polar amino acid transport system substrate-binding protein|nr:transporter substrate-binding domain-containing protein [Spirochaetia bacterium]